MTRQRLGCEPLEARLLLSATPFDGATPLDLSRTSAVVGHVSEAAPLAVFRADTAGGRLDVRLDSAAKGLRLSLFAADGTKLLDSVGAPADGTAARVDPFVVGTVFVAVEGHADADFSLTTTYEAAFDSPPAALQLRDLTTGDFDGDGRGDLVWLGHDDEGRSTLLLRSGQGDGSFRDGGALALPFTGVKLIAGNFDATGGTQLLVFGHAEGPRVGVVRWGEGGLVLTDAPGTPEAAFRPHATPLAADLDRDGITDVTVVAGDGRILFRRGLADGAYAPPVVVNAEPMLAASLVVGPAGPALVALAREGRRGFVYSYDPQSSQFVALAVPLPGDLPTAGVLADLDGDGVAELVVANPYSGDVSVFRAGVEAGRYRANLGLVSMGIVARAFDQPTALAAGDLDGDGFADVVVLHAAAGYAQVLRGRGDGTLYDPDEADRFAVPTGSEAIVVGPGRSVVVLDRDGGQVIVYERREGGWRERHRIAAGTAPTGMSLDVVHGRADLLVGNTFGDVLRLVGNGDGTFQAARRLMQRVALAVEDLDGDGVDDFVFASEADDRVTISSGDDGETLGVLTGMAAPGRVHLADLNGDGVDDLIVCNTGGNNVLIYLGLGGGKFGPEIAGGTGTFTGIAPADVAVGLLADGRPALVVANEGSNDVTVLFVEDEGGWHLRTGPRLAVGAGPAAILLRDLDADGVAELIVTHRAGGTVMILPGLGRGLFDDRAARVLDVGSQPSHSVAGDFDGDGRTDLVTLDGGSDTLTFYSDVASPDATRQTLASGGQGPIAALVRDVNGDGVDDVLVANYEDGRASLFTGGAAGLRLAEVVELGGHPTALAAGEGLDGRSFYVAGAGSESATLARFFAATATPEVPPPPTIDPTFPLSFDPPPTLAAPAARPTVVELQPLTATTVDLIPAATASEAGASDADEAPAAPGVKPNVGGKPADAPTSAPQPVAPGEEVREEAEERRVEDAGGAERYLLGLDDVKPPKLGGDDVAEVRSLQPLDTPAPAESTPAAEAVALAEAEAEEETESVTREEPAPASRPWGGVLLVLASWGLAWQWRDGRRGTTKHTK